MNTKTLRCDADTVNAVAEWAKERGLNTAEATTILLASALGRQRAAQLNAAELGGNGGANGHAEDDEEEENGDTHDVLPVPPSRPDEPPPIQALDAATEALIDEIVSIQCWGLHPIESQLLRDHPDFILADPPTTRTRFMDLIREAEHLGHKRNSTSMLAVLLERLQGRPSPGNRSVGPAAALAALDATLSARR
jgi:hypothetical protein